MLIKNKRQSYQHKMYLRRKPQESIIYNRILKMLTNKSLSLVHTQTHKRVEPQAMILIIKINKISLCPSKRN